MDTVMEYVPMTIKQEVEPASSIINETINGSAASTNNNNNNSSQAAPDSVENKVSKLFVTS